MMQGGMMQGMHSMMAWMMGLGLLGWVLVIVPVVAIVVFLVQLLTRAGPCERAESRPPARTPD